MDSLRLARSRNSYKELGIYGVAMRTYRRHSVEMKARIAVSKIIVLFLFIFSIVTFYIHDFVLHNTQSFVSDFTFFCEIINTPNSY